MTEILASSDGMEKLLKEKRPRLDKQLEIEERDGVNITTKGDVTLGDG